MRPLNSNPNVDNSDLINYPGGRIKDNTGTGNGTPVNERVKGDIHQAVEKLMRLYSITPNELPDNETNGFQIIDALRALASKNNFVLLLGVSSGVIQVAVKVGSMLENEQIVCKASFNYGSETQIKGLDNVTLTATVQGSFKTNEYVRLIKTASGATLVRLSDNASLDSMVGGFSYLKKATQVEEDAGLIETVATTPKTNLTAFIKRVIGVDSVNYLATALRNGLYPKEHYAIVDGLGTSNVKNRGVFKGVDVGGMPVGTSLGIAGQCTSAITFSISGQNEGNTFIEVTIPNAMSSSNYLVKLYMESKGFLQFDNDLHSPVWKTVSPTVFRVGIAEASPSSQLINFHFETVEIPYTS